MKIFSAHAVEQLCQLFSNLVEVPSALKGYTAEVTEAQLNIVRMNK
jgi:hypothetical protein